MASGIVQGYPTKDSQRSKDILDVHAKTSSAGSKRTKQALLKTLNISPAKSKKIGSLIDIMHEYFTRFEEMRVAREGTLDIFMEMFALLEEYKADPGHPMRDFVLDGEHMAQLLLDNDQRQAIIFVDNISESRQIAFRNIRSPYYHVFDLGLFTCFVTNWNRTKPKTPEHPELLRRTKEELMSSLEGDGVIAFFGSTKSIGKMNKRAWSEIRAAMETLIRMGKKPIILNGGFRYGVPYAASLIGESCGLKIASVMPRIGRYHTVKADKLIIEGDDWGDEAWLLTGLADGAIFLGGNTWTEIEYVCLKDRPTPMVSISGFNGMGNTLFPESQRVASGRSAAIHLVLQLALNSPNPIEEIEKALSSAVSLAKDAKERKEVAILFNRALVSLSQEARDRILPELFKLFSGRKYSALTKETESPELQGEDIGIASLAVRTNIDFYPNISRFPKQKPRTLNAGGEGVNIARALTGWGAKAPVFGFLGRDENLDNVMANLMHSEGLSTEFMLRSGGLTSIYCHVRGAEEEIGCITSGPQVSTEQIARLEDSIFENLEAGDTLVVAAGWPNKEFAEDYFTILIQKAKERGIKIFFNSKSIGALRTGVAASPYLVSLNLNELAELYDVSADSLSGDIERIRDLGTRITNDGVEVVVITLGKDGALLLTEDAAYLAVPPKIEVRSAIGSGDALLAGVAYKLAQGEDFKEALRFGVAAGTVTATKPGTGLAELVEIEELCDSVELKELSKASSPGTSMQGLLPGAQRAIRLTRYSEEEIVAAEKADKVLGRPIGLEIEIAGGTEGIEEYKEFGDISVGNRVDWAASQMPMNRELATEVALWKFFEISLKHSRSILSQQVQAQAIREKADRSGQKIISVQANIGIPRDQILRHPVKSYKYLQDARKLSLALALVYASDDRIRDKKTPKVASYRFKATEPVDGKKSARVEYGFLDAVNLDKIMRSLHRLDAVLYSFHYESGKKDNEVVKVYNQITEIFNDLRRMRLWLRGVRASDGLSYKRFLAWRRRHPEQVDILRKNIELAVKSVEACIVDKGVAKPEPFSDGEKLDFQGRVTAELSRRFQESGIGFEYTFEGNAVLVSVPWASPETGPDGTSIRAVQDILNEILRDLEKNSLVASGKVHIYGHPAPKHTNIVRLAIDGKVKSSSPGGRLDRRAYAGATRWLKNEILRSLPDADLPEEVKRRVRSELMARLPFFGLSEKIIEYSKESDQLREFLIDCCRRNRYFADIIFNQAVIYNSRLLGRNAQGTTDLIKTISFFLWDIHPEPSSYFRSHFAAIFLRLDQLIIPDDLKPSDPKVNGMVKNMRATKDRYWRGRQKPIKVTLADDDLGRYMVIDGESKLEAAKAIGLDYVPALFVPHHDAENMLRARRRKSSSPGKALGGIVESLKRFLPQREPTSRERYDAIREGMIKAAAKKRAVFEEIDSAA